MITIFSVSRKATVNNIVLPNLHPFHIEANLDTADSEYSKKFCRHFKM